MIKEKLIKRIVQVGILLSGIVCFVSAQEVITIEKALDIAEENNPTLRQRKLDIERYQLNLKAQRASLKSQFSLDLNPVSYSNTRRFDNRLSQWYNNETFNSSGTFRVAQPILATDGVISLVNTFGWQNNYSVVEGMGNRNRAFTNDLYLQLSQPIFTYNTRKLRLKQIEFDYENAGISYALQRLTTERNITNQFYSVYMAQSNLDIRKEEYENAKQNYEIIKNKVDADLAAKEELYQAEVNLATAQSSVEERTVSLENAKDVLKQSLGMSLNDNIVIIANIDFNPVLINSEDAIHKGLASRMELRQREISVELSELDIVVEEASNEFKGDISLSVGIIGDHERFENIYDKPRQSPRVAISFNVPIFDWGAKKARVQARRTSQTIAKLQHADQKISIELEIRQITRELDNLRTQIDIAEKNVRNAQLTYDLNLTRYREGELTGMQISQFQTQLSERKISYAQALINYKIALLNIKILSLYDYEKDKPIVPIRELGEKGIE